MNNIKIITPDLSQIKDNTPALKIGDKYFACGIGGNFIPAGQGGSSMNFYKCASVGTGTWSGYLASVDPVTGIWSFAETATTGLTYDRLTPVVGSVYDEGCTFRVTNYKDSMPSENLVFYLPLDSARSTAITGQALTMSGNVVFTEVQGIPCAYFDGSSGYTTPAIDLSQFSNGFTLSVWINQTKYGNNNIFGRRSALMQSQFVFGVIESKHYMWAADDQDTIVQTTAIQQTGLHHLLYTYSNDNCSIYINNTLITNGNISLGYNSGDIKIGMSSYSSDQNFEGYIASLRLYSRVLDSSEIAALASEFTPTIS